MFWKKDNSIEKTDRKLEQVNDLVKRSFLNVKRDTSTLFQWINYLYRQSLEQEYKIKQLETEISYIPKTRDEIRKIVDDYYSFEHLLSKISELNHRINELEIRREIPQIETPAQTIVRSLPEVEEIERRLEKLEQKKAAIKEKIVARLTRNSKEYIKGIMLSYIKKYERISALKLKDMVVDEQNLCSKSSFYRLLEEVEQLEDIGVLKQGKEKHYMFKVARQH